MKRSKLTLLSTGKLDKPTVLLRLQYWYYYYGISYFFFNFCRQRGYKVGSLMTGPEDPDTYYKQPGHPLSPDSERFKVP